MKYVWWNKMRLSPIFFSIFTIFVTLLLGCTGGNPAWEYMPDMADQPALKAQKYVEGLPKHRGMLSPPEGTIPRNFEPYPYKEDPEGAGRNLKNPLLVSEEILIAGQRSFNTYCSVCHGLKGLGDGPVVPSFPKPPSLTSEKIKGWADGRIYHVISVGQNLMPSYASQLPAEKRWSIVHYIRALQRAEHPIPEDLEAYKQYRTEKKP